MKIVCANCGNKIEYNNKVYYCSACGRRIDFVNITMDNKDFKIKKSNA